jgi:DNA invertase Pin-like site-specific DNA recombinase
MIKRLRCAIYTRKSSEEGLDQEFNSLAAQREACEAYVRSQHASGWRMLSQAYDDGGISGATLERPALQQLLSDIEEARVDIVVVYKVDRLTRTLSDFARLVELFDAHKISFVSVTQQFNTTTSMGRLTLNVLLSFAQFEREVTGERIRDKIAASKRKGLWMGGIAPLGYDAKDRALVVNPEEAEIVRKLFHLYLELGSVRQVVASAKRERLKTRLGNDFTKGGLYVLLQNPIYVGRVRHKNRTFPGRHEPIVNKATWDTVRQRMADQRIRQHHRLSAKEPSLLAGKLYGPEGQSLTPSHASKKGRRYRYYVETDTETANKPHERPLRVAASEIEELILNALQNFLGDSQRILEAVHPDELCPQAAHRLTSQARDLQEDLRDPAKRQILTRKLLARVDVGEKAVRVHLARPALLNALAVVDSTHHAEPVELTISANLKRLGAQLRFISGNREAIQHQASSRPFSKPDAGGGSGSSMARRVSSRSHERKGSMTAT